MVCPPRRADAPKNRGASLAGAVRPPGVAARPRRQIVFIPLSPGNLYARAQARAWLLRAAIPVRRPAGGTRRSESRTQIRQLARARRLRRTARPARDGG